MTVLHAEDLEESHPYLANARPGWSRSLASIQAHGGPWHCPGCRGPSYLNYRCSKCGKDLANADTSRAGRQP